MIDLQSSLQYHHPKTQEILGAADVIIFQRNVILEEVWNAMRYWRALGKIVLVDIDDHYPALPGSNPAYKFWIKNAHNLDPNPIERFRIGLSHSDGLISPSRIILKDWENEVRGYYWPNYAQIGNYAHLQPKRIGQPDTLFHYDVSDPEKPVLQRSPQQGTADKVVIGWGGSISHVDSFIYSGVLEALQRLMEENDKVIFKFCGHEQRLATWLDKLPQKQLQIQGGVSLQHWPEVVASFDIGIAPLDLRPVEAKTGNEHGEYSYDERRSDLKLVEYLCAGVPFVATRSAPYKKLGRHGKLVGASADEWYEALKARVESLQHFKKDAQDKRGWALKKLTIEANVKRLIRFYQGIGLDVETSKGTRLPDAIYLD